MDGLRTQVEVGQTDLLKAAFREKDETSTVWVCAQPNTFVLEVFRGNTLRPVKTKIMDISFLFQLPHSCSIATIFKNIGMCETFV